MATWMSDQVPDEIRKRCFRTGNMVCGSAIVAVMVLFGSMLDHLNHRFFEGVLLGFGITIFYAHLHPFVEIENTEA